MNMLMNRYLSKISFGGFLRNFPDDINMSGNGVKSNQQQQQSSQNDGGNDDDDDDADKESKEINALLGIGDDEEDEDFDVGGNDDDEESDEQKAAANEASKQLGLQIKKKISELAFDESDIPDNMDWSDKKAVSALMSKNSQKAVEGAVSMIPSILTHALGLIVPKLEAKIEKAVGTQGTKATAKTEFDSLGFTGGDRAFAKTIYERALKQKMSPAKAATATRKAMATLGKEGASNQQGNGGRRNQSGKNQGGRLEGTSALDDIFG